VVSQPVSRQTAAPVMVKGMMFFIIFIVCAKEVIRGVLDTNVITTKGDGRVN
jgi:hypothetical protein